MRRALDLAYDGCLALAGAFLLGIFALMVFEPVFRWFGSYITGANELIAAGCVRHAITSFASYAGRNSPSAAFDVARHSSWRPSARVRATPPRSNAMPSRGNARNWRSRTRKS